MSSASTQQPQQQQQQEEDLTNMEIIEALRQIPTA
jgi:hypothetical protein